MMIWIAIILFSPLAAFWRGGFSAMVINVCLSLLIPVIGGILHAAWLEQEHKKEQERRKMVAMAQGRYYETR